MQELMKWLTAQWTTRFSEIALTMGDLQLKMHVNHVEYHPQQDVLWWEQPFDCSPKHPSGSALLRPPGLSSQS